MRTLITYLFASFFCASIFGQENVVNDSLENLDSLKTVVPVAPYNLEANLEKSGALELYWDCDTSDVLGYEVYVSSQKSSDYILFNKEEILNNQYQDFLKQSKNQKTYFFKVRSVYSDSLFSSFSNIADVTTHDIIPPETPNFTAVDVLPKGIMLQWDEVAADTKLIKVYRKETEYDDPTIIEVSNPIKGIFMDETFEMGKWYYYSLVAVDESGNESKESNSIKAYAEDMRPKDGAYNIEAEVTAFEEIKLTWEVKNSTAFKFEIYKSVNGRGLELYQKILAGKNVFFDSQVKKKKTYSYQIRTIYSDGTFSQLSEVIVVEIK